MSFPAEWLALRAGADARARDPGLAERLKAHFALREGLRVLDLGAGTGAMMRAAAPFLGPGQRWRLVDSDAALLKLAEAPEGVTVEQTVTDLAGDLPPLFDPEPDLVTSSAFLDLCGAAWIDRLVARVAETGAALYVVLTYDGREVWVPPHPLDEKVLAAFSADQRRDKGLGPALGPEAATRLAEALRRAGYEVWTAPSNWQLASPADAVLIAELAAGTADAVAPGLGREASEDWRRSRAGAASVTIGHTDLLALPPDHSGP